MNRPVYRRGGSRNAGAPTFGEIASSSIARTNFPQREEGYVTKPCERGKCYQCTSLRCSHDCHEAVK